MQKKRKGNGIVLKIAICLLFCAMAGCKKAPEGPEKNGGQESRQIFAMDTYMTLQIYGAQAKEAANAAVKEIGRLNRLLSTGNEESEIFGLNREKTGTLSEDSRILLENSLRIFEETDGAFDITVYPIMCAWNFTGEKPRVPDAEEIKKLLPLVDSSGMQYDSETGVLVLPEQMEIDFGGIAKGYTGVRLAQILETYGISSAMLNLGGNVQLIGAKPDGSDWKIAIQSPDKQGYLGVASLKDCAVVTSGGYERCFTEKGVTYHHIIDPSTGYPAENGLRSVTVICKDGTRADGLSTALFVKGTERAIAFWREHRNEFDLVLYTEDEELFVTEGLKSLFSSEKQFQIIE